MNLGIKGKKALVTGGASGIGKAIVEELVKEGARVVFTSRKQEVIDKTLKAIGGVKAGHLGVKTEISEEGAPDKLAKYIWKNFGELDIVVNNVGATFEISDPYCPISDWRKVFRLNLEVAVELNNLFIPHMKKQDWGRIVNISSNASMENSGPVTFCASKAAYTAYTRCMGRILAIEAKNVVMSTVLPGVVLTEEGHWQEVLKTRPEHAEKYLRERCPSGRFGKPSEISPMVVLLCSELATFCHGSIISVDAGQARHYFHVNGVGN
jgi:NAD(P)-dependent dehydrogenase (short-subunit alcohol dehydrogenase family)